MTAMLVAQATGLLGDGDALTTEEELAAYFAYCQEVADTADADIRPELEADVSPEEWVARGRRWAEAVSSCKLIGPDERARISMLFIREMTGAKALEAFRVSADKALEAFRFAAFDVGASVSEGLAARGATDQREQERLRVAERVSARGPDAGWLTSAPNSITSSSAVGGLEMR